MFVLEECTVESICAAFESGELMDAEMIALTEQSCKVLKKCGAKLVQDTKVGHLKNDLNAMLYEFNKALNAAAYACEQASRARRAPVLSGKRARKEAGWSGSEGGIAPLTKNFCCYILISGR